MFIDSVVWIALKYDRDQWHPHALKLKDRISKVKKIFITDFIVIESYNFLLRKVSSETAQDTLNVFLNSEKIEILYNDAISILASQQILFNNPKLSLTDANIVFYSLLQKDFEILSFDSVFDKVPEIKRIF